MSHLLLPLVACSTQTGRKASGAFKSFYDKDYLKIGLRKQPGTQPGKQ